MKTVFQEDPNKEEFTIDGRKVTPQQFEAIKSAFPGDYLVISFEDAPYTQTRNILHTKTDFENGDY